MIKIRHSQAAWLWLAAIASTYVSLALGATLPDTRTKSSSRFIGQIQPLPNHPAYVALSHDGSRLAVGNVLSKDIRIFEVPSLKLLRTFDRPGSTSALTFSSPHTHLAVGDIFSRLAPQRNGIRIWDIESGQLLFEPAGFIEGTGAENDVQALAFSPGGRVVVASLQSHHAMRKCCYLFKVDLDTKNVKGFGSNLSYAIAFDPSGNRIAEGGFGGLRLWSGNAEKLLWSTIPFIHESKSDKAIDLPVGSLAFSPNGKQLLVGPKYGKPVPLPKIYDSVNGKLIATLDIKAEYGPVLVGYSADGRWIVIAAGQKTWLADVSTLKIVDNFSLPGNAFSLSISAASKYYAIGTTGKAQESGKGGNVVIMEFPAHR